MGMRRGGPSRDRLELQVVTKDWDPGQRRDSHLLQGARADYGWGERSRRLRCDPTSMSNPGPSESRGSSASSASSASSGSRAFLLAASLVVVIGCSIGSGSGGNGFAPTGGNGGTGVGGSLVPVVNSITPPQATPGATVTIAGENLVDPGATAITQNLHLANPVPTQVFFNLEQAVITSATATEIRVTYPRDYRRARL